MIIRLSRSSNNIVVFQRLFVGTWTRKKKFAPTVAAVWGSHSRHGFSPGSSHVPELCTWGAGNVAPLSRLSACGCERPCDGRASCPGQTPFCGPSRQDRLWPPLARLCESFLNMSSSHLCQCLIFKCLGL